MLELIQEMIHKNNIAPAEGIAEKIAGFEERYDSLVQTAAKKYGVPPSDYYRDGYNSNPLVEPDNNLCERKARILKGKINQAVSLKSFQHLEYFCECLNVIDHFATDDKNNLYQYLQKTKDGQAKTRKYRTF